MSACTLAARGRNPLPRGLVPYAPATGAPGSVNSNHRLGRLGAMLAVVWTLGSGCALNQVPATATPVTASKEHSEVAELEKSIADHKASLRSSGDDRLAGAPTTDTSPTPMSGGPAPSPRCDGVCRAAQEICTASRRICKIAGQLNESAITTSCQRAERSCTDASALCSQCR